MLNVWNENEHAMNVIKQIFPAVLITAIGITVLGIGLIFFPKQENPLEIPLGRVLLYRGPIVGKTFTNRTILIMESFNVVVIKDCSFYEQQGEVVWIGAQKNLNIAHIKISGCYFSGVGDFIRDGDAQ